jgi:hypothetical protein
MGRGNHASQMRIIAGRDWPGAGQALSPEHCRHEQRPQARPAGLRRLTPRNSMRKVHVAAHAKLCALALCVDGCDDVLGAHQTQSDGRRR